MAVRAKIKVYFVNSLLHSKWYIGWTSVKGGVHIKLYMYWVCRLITYSYIHEARMSPTLSGSSALQTQQCNWNTQQNSIKFLLVSSYWVTGQQSVPPTSDSYTGCWKLLHLINSKHHQIWNATCNPTVHVMNQMTILMTTGMQCNPQVIKKQLVCKKCHEWSFQGVIQRVYNIPST